MMHFFSRLSLATLVMFILSACGQKGPLFLPTKPTAISTPYPAAPANPPQENSQHEEN